MISAHRERVWLEFECTKGYFHYISIHGHCKRTFDRKLDLFVAINRMYIHNIKKISGSSDEKDKTKHVTRLKINANLSDKLRRRMKSSILVL